MDELSEDDKMVLALAQNRHAYQVNTSALSLQCIGWLMLSHKIRPSITMPGRQSQNHSAGQELRQN